MIRMTLLGAPELVKALHMARKVGFGTPFLVRVITKAVKPMQAKAEQLVPRGRTGNLARAFKVVKARVGRKGLAKIYFTNTAPHAHLIEWGTKERKTGATKGKSTGNKVRKTGKVNAAPFMLPAYLATKDQVEREMFIQLSAELLKLGKRVARRAAAGTLGKRARKALA